jgi:hypothetical protein
VARPASRVPVIAQALRLALVLLAVGCVGCSLFGGAPVDSTQSSRAGAPPEWRPGDRWKYRVNGSAIETRTVDVLDTREVGGTLYYVVRHSDSDILNYWTLDLGWAFAAQSGDSRVTARTDQPMPWFKWPLQVGHRWTYQGVYEDRSGKRDLNETFMVVATETVDVPAGRFEALKVVREGQSADSDQYWYAPEVRSYVKWIVRRGDKRVEEELVEFKPAERLIPAPGTPPSK